MSIRHKQLSATVTKTGDRSFDFVISSSRVDSDGDVVHVNGLDLSRYRKNPVVLAFHDHAKPIGKARNLRIAGDKLLATVDFAEGSQLAREIHALVDEGVLTSTSIGFQPKRIKPRDSGGFDILEAVLLEFSIVSIPANEDARVIRRLKSLGVIPKSIDEMSPKVLRGYIRALARHEIKSRAPKVS